MKEKGYLLVCRGRGAGVELLIGYQTNANQEQHQYKVAAEGIGKELVQPGRNGEKRGPVHGLFHSLSGLLFLLLPQIAGLSRMVLMKPETAARTEGQG
jgi:hypothetical protein